MHLWYHISRLHLSVEFGQIHVNQAKHFISLNSCVNRDVLNFCSAYKVYNFLLSYCSIKVYYNQGESILFRVQSGEMEDIKEITTRLSAVSQGCEVRKMINSLILLVNKEITQLEHIVLVRHLTTCFNIYWLLLRWLPKSAHGGSRLISCVVICPQTSKPYTECLYFDVTNNVVKLNFCWFIVDSTQYSRYLDLPSLMVGKFHKPPSICREKAAKRILPQVRIEPAPS